MNTLTGVLILFVIGITACSCFTITERIKSYDSDSAIHLPLPTASAGKAVAIIERLPDGLQVTFKVEDDDVVVLPEKELWESDCVELYVDLRPYRLRTLHNYYEAGVMQITVQAPTHRATPRWTFRSAGVPAPDGLRVLGKRTKYGYILQIFLPEATTRALHGPLRETIYLDVAVNNIQPDGSSAKSYWKGNGENWQSPANFAPVIFSTSSYDKEP